MTAFRCGHPREPGNIYRRPNDGHESCAFCIRVRRLCKSAELAQRRINAGGYTLGERIASGKA